MSWIIQKPTHLFFIWKEDRKMTNRQTKLDLIDALASRGIYFKQVNDVEYRVTDIKLGKGTYLIEFK